jgi:hypothetical protein
MNEMLLRGDAEAKMTTACACDVYLDVLDRYREGLSVGIKWWQNR